MSGIWKRRHGQIFRHRQPKGSGTVKAGPTSTAPDLDSTLSRGFPVVLALQHHPRKFFPGLLDHFAAPEQDAEFRVQHLTRTNDLRGRRRKRLPRGKPRLRRSFALPEPCLLRQPEPILALMG